MFGLPCPASLNTETISWNLITSRASKSAGPSRGMTLGGPRNGPQRWRTFAELLHQTVLGHSILMRCLACVVNGWPAKRLFAVRQHGTRVCSLTECCALGT